MGGNDNLKRPSIKVYMDNGVYMNQGIMNVFWGIEEEGIPYEKVLDNGDAITLSYKGAIESKLGVGIGIDKDLVVLHFNKLNKKEPLLKYRTTEDEMILRSIGTNGARLVKRMPLKIYKEEVIEDVVTNIVKKLKGD